MSSVGMMQGAFFKGRAECLRWVNETLDVNLSKVVFQKFKKWKVMFCNVNGGVFDVFRWSSVRMVRSTAKLWTLSITTRSAWLG